MDTAVSVLLSLMVGTSSFPSWYDVSTLTTAIDSYQCDDFCLQAVNTTLGIDTDLLTSPYDLVVETMVGHGRAVLQKTYSNLTLTPDDLDFAAIRTLAPVVSLRAQALEADLMAYMANESSQVIERVIIGLFVLTLLVTGWVYIHYFRRLLTESREELVQTVDLIWLVSSSHIYQHFSTRQNFLEN